MIQFFRCHNWHSAWLTWTFILRLGWAQIQTEWGTNIRGSFDPMHYACFRAIDISLTTGTLRFEILTTAAANNVAVPGTKSDVQGERKR